MANFQLSNSVIYFILIVIIVILVIALLCKKEGFIFSDYGYTAGSGPCAYNYVYQPADANPFNITCEGYMKKHVPVSESSCCAPYGAYVNESSGIYE